MVTQQPGTPTRPVLLSGTIPPRADGYSPRGETGPDLAGSLRLGETVVLVHGEVTYAAPASQGGTGKTQLAAEFSRALRETGAVEVLAWVNAVSRESAVTGFAQAAGMVDAGPPGAEGEAAAAGFVSWLDRTRRPWALVLDDLGETEDLEGLWPCGPSGRVLVTSRLPATAFEGRQVRLVPVGRLSQGEALEYLTSLLEIAPGERMEARDLAEDLDGLPLALAQAAAAMSIRDEGFGDYRARLGKQRRESKAVPGVSAPVLATWSLAVECARGLPPEGRAWPALVLAAMMDYHGVPDAVLTSPAACGYILGHPSTAGRADRDRVWAALENLAQAGLVAIDPASPARTVQMHASVQAATRAYLPGADLEQVVLAVAGALAQAWPDGTVQLGKTRPEQAELEQALRDCAAAVRAVGGSMLWKPDAHPLLFLTGQSLERGSLWEAAVTYWRSMTATSTTLLGSAHAHAVAARDHLARAYEAVGRHAEAIATHQAAVADRERHQGPGHAETMAARARLARAYQSADRLADAIAEYQGVTAGAGRALGPGHPVTLEAWAGLARAYQAAGQPREAIAAARRLVSDAGRQLGPNHPVTLGAQASLAAAYAASGRNKDAIGTYQTALAGHERAHGPDHLDTITARAALASAFRAADKPKEAITQYQQVLADRERVQGSDHPDTIAARANLAYAYRGAGRLRDAIPHYEQTLADRERVQGADHRDTLTARANLAAAYQQARRLADAIPQYERALADGEQILGPGDEQTLTIRCNLATAYYTAGRLTDVVTVLRRALADCEQHLGPGHPMTQTVRENLSAATRN